MNILIEEIIDDLHRCKSDSGNPIFDEWSPIIDKLKVTSKRIEEIEKNCIESCTNYEEAQIIRDERISELKLKIKSMSDKWHNLRCRTDLLKLEKAYGTNAIFEDLETGDRLTVPSMLHRKLMSPRAFNVHVKYVETI